MAMPSNDHKAGNDKDAQAAPSIDIELRIEHGLLMAFGPDGDPVTPRLVKETFADDLDGSCRYGTGQDIPRRRALAVLDAQQRGPLAKRRSDPWIESMLGLAGGFEPTPPELLESEPNLPMPPLPDASPVDMER